MIGRGLLSLAAGLSVIAWGWSATAQAPACRYFQTQANNANVSKDPRPDAIFIDLLEKGDVVCVTREQNVGEGKWGYVSSRVVKRTERIPINGWVDLRQFTPLASSEINTIAGDPAPAPPAPTAAVPPPLPPAAAPPPPAATARAPSPRVATPPPAASAPAAVDDILRYSNPVPFGPFPVNGSSIEQLARGIPQFPPFEGLEESIWKKNCSSCHKWDRQALCEQGSTYAKNPKNALRNPHPFGGAYKTALMQWAKSGCQ